MATGSARETCQALLIDLDGVVRIFDPTVSQGVEERYGLPQGILTKVAFEPMRLRPAITGQISHDEWMAEVAREIGRSLDDEARAQAAVQEWNTYRGQVDQAVLDFVREVRRAGIRVGLATNATDWLEADLERLGLVGEFDAVINSSVVGYIKPSRDFFRAACLAVQAEPKVTLFVDDTDRNVLGARAADLSAYRYNGPEDFRYLRAVLGLRAA